MDALDLSGHAAHWHADLDATVHAGLRQLRYPARWHRVEASRFLPGSPRRDCEPTGRRHHPVWLEVPRRVTADQPNFDDACAVDYGTLVAELLRRDGRGTPDLWLYTPMGLDLVDDIGAERLVHDVTDDLSSFRNAPAGLRVRQRVLLEEADVVFTGGGRCTSRSCGSAATGCTCFPAAWRPATTPAARTLRVPRSRPVAGYVGVLDERLDLGLVGELSRRLPDWTIRMVGPTAKLEQGSLATAANPK